MNTIHTCRHAIAMLEDEQSMTGWSDAHTAALRLAVQFLVNSATGHDAEDQRDAARYRWLRDVASGADWEQIGQTSDPTNTDAIIDAAIACLNMATRG